ncbi:hypothetical protein B0T16DRAFT_450886 [Cercophora newfieldiana]|uniref:Uncharacterized protein n=1 Tax=Cercophora newfieldiana TaxID=92897 RepID=A0AA39YP19_9PEZI|nr:hypothetical protein B0T16DRAFT_450886 [Cercophora newfieldiana]
MGLQWRWKQPKGVRALTAEELAKLPGHKKIRNRHIMIQVAMIIAAIVVVILNGKIPPLQSTFLLSGCTSAKLPGISDLYLLEMTIPDCKAKLRVGPLGMCVLDENDPPTVSCLGIAMGSENAYERLSAVTNHCRQAVQALKAGQAFQSRIMLCAGIASAVILFAVAFIPLGLWLWLNRYPYWEGDKTARWKSKKPKQSVQEKEREWRKWKWGYERRDPVWKGFIWLLFLASVLSALAGCFSVWQITSAVAITTEDFSTRVQIERGVRHFALQWVAVVVEVFFLIGLFYTTQDKWLFKKWETAKIAMGDMLRPRYWRWEGGEFGGGGHIQNQKPQQKKKAPVSEKPQQKAPVSKSEKPKPLGPSRAPSTPSLQPPTHAAPWDAMSTTEVDEGDDPPPTYSSSRFLFKRKPIPEEPGKPASAMDARELLRIAK